MCHKDGVKCSKDENCSPVDPVQTVLLRGSQRRQIAPSVLSVYMYQTTWNEITLLMIEQTLQICNLRISYKQ